MKNACYGSVIHIMFVLNYILYAVTNMPQTQLSVSPIWGLNEVCTEEEKEYVRIDIKLFIRG